MKTTGRIGTIIGLLCLCAPAMAAAQTADGTSSSNPKDKPAYVVRDVSSPSIKITPSWKANETITNVTTLRIEYEKKTPTAPERVLLGIESGSKSNLLTASDATVLTGPRGTIALSVPVAFASFMIKSLRWNKSADAPGEEIIEVRIALYEVGANTDAEKKPQYGRQVSNRVSLRLLPD